MFSLNAINTVEIVGDCTTFVSKSHLPPDYDGSHIVLPMDLTITISLNIENVCISFEDRCGGGRMNYPQCGFCTWLEPKNFCLIVMFSQAILQQTGWNVGDELTWTIRHDISANQKTFLTGDEIRRVNMTVDFSKV